MGVVPRLGEVFPAGFEELGVHEPVHAPVSGPRHVFHRLARRNRLVNRHLAGGLRHEREVGDFMAPIRNTGGRELVVLAGVRKTLLVPRGLDDFHRLFEMFAVGGVVLGTHIVVTAGHPGPQRQRLTRNRATANAELHATTGENVGHGEVFSQAQGMPLGHHVEHLAKAYPLGVLGHRHPKQHEVRGDFVALVLEVMLGKPHAMNTGVVGRLAPVGEIFVAGNEVGVSVPPIGGSRSGVSGIRHWDVAVKVQINAHPLKIEAATEVLWRRNPVTQSLSSNAMAPPPASEREILTWELFGTGSRELAQLVADADWVPDIILAIARGGLLPAGTLGYALSIKNVFVISVEYYTGIGETLEFPVMLPPQLNLVDLTDQKVLIVDDVADTGHTLKAVLEFVGTSVQEVRTAVIYEKPQSVVKCDFVWRRTDRWIDFPWSDKAPIVGDGDGH